MSNLLLTLLSIFVILLAWGFYAKIWQNPQPTKPKLTWRAIFQAMHAGETLKQSKTYSTPDRAEFCNSRITIYYQSWASGYEIMAIRVKGYQGQYLITFLNGVLAEWFRHEHKTPLEEISVRLRNAAKDLLQAVHAAGARFFVTGIATLIS